MSPDQNTTNTSHNNTHHQLLRNADKSNTGINIARDTTIQQRLLVTWHHLHRVSEKNSQNCFCHNFIIFSLNLIIFGKRRAKAMKLCKVYSLSISP